MKNLVFVGVLALATGCSGDAQGTSVGNPNTTLLRLADPGPDVVLDAAPATLSEVVLIDETGRTVIDGPLDGDLLDGILFDLPDGDYTELAVTFEGPVAAVGVSHGADAVDLELTVDTVRVLAAMPVRVRRDAFVFELAEPEWLQPERVGWRVGEDHVVRPGDAVHDALVATIVRRSALLEDRDEDGEADPGRDPAAEGDQRSR